MLESQGQNNVNDQEIKDQKRGIKKLDSILNENDVLRDLKIKIDKYQKRRDEIRGKIKDAIQAGEIDPSESCEEKVKRFLELGKEMEDETGMRYSELEWFYQREKNKQFGLNSERLEEVRRKLGEFIKYPRSAAYEAILSIVEIILGENLTGRTIVEVGPGDTGTEALAYFASKGAKAVGLGPHRKISHDEEEVHGQKVRLTGGNWDNLTEVMGGEKVDIVYYTFMHPSPELGGKFEGDKEGFAKHVIREMYQVLKSGGCCIGHNPCGYGGEFLIPPEMFPDNEYDKMTFLDSSLIISDSIKPVVEREELGFGVLHVCQKKEL